MMQQKHNVVTLDTRRILPEVATRHLAKVQEGLQRFLGSGLAYGQLTEFGIPWGSDGRRLLQHIVAAATQDHQWCLWVHDQQEMSLYPPSWEASGVDLSYLRVAKCQPAASRDPQAAPPRVAKLSYAPNRGQSSRYSSAVSDLKAVLMSDFFRVLIIDSHIAPQDYTFLARRARLQNQLIFVVRKHFLSPKMGNIWAKNRFNCWGDPLQGRLFVRTIKGRNKHQIAIENHLLREVTQTFTIPQQAEG